MRRAAAFLFLLAPLPAAAAALPPCAGEWAVYDDFTATAPSLEGRWTTNDPSGRFKADDGGLRFEATAGPTGRLYSTAKFGAGQFLLDFKNYVSTNHSAGGLGEGSYAALGLGRSGDYVRVMRGDIRNGPYFEANHVVDGAHAVWFRHGAADQGRLAIHASQDGVRMFASATLDGDEAWEPIGPVLHPDWTGPVPVMVLGSAGASGATGFTVLRVMARRCGP